MVRSLRSGRIPHQSSGREEGGGEGSAHPSAKRVRRGSNNRGAQQNDTSTSSNNNQRQSVRCAKCDKSLPSDADHIKIHPCKHALCTVCAYRSQIDRGSKPHQCPVPSCNCYSTKSEYCYGHPANNNDNEMIDNVIIGDSEFVKNNLPLEYLKQRHANEIREDKQHEAIVLHCSKAKLDGDGYLVVQSVTSTLVIKKTTKDDVAILNNNQALIEIQNFFGFLHYPIVRTSNTDETHPPVLSPRELLEMRCQRRRILDCALYALSTGIIEFDATRFLNPDSSDYQKHFMAAAITSDILIRNLNNKPGYFQLMFGELLVRQQITKEFKDLCSILNLAPSRKYILKSRARDVLEQLNDGLKLNPRDFVILLFDNIGFKILGRQASYDQWIVINIVVVTEDELRAVGFYRDDDESDTATISREQSVDWTEEVNNVSTELEINALADSIIGITDHDFDRLSESVLEGIKFAIDNKVHLSLDTGTNQQSPIPLPRFERIINEETRVEMDARKDGKQPAAPPQQQQQQQQQRVQSESHSVVLPRDYIPSDVTNELVALKLMRNSERIGQRGSVSLFLTAVKFALPLFALTHKSDYVFLCQDLLKFYHCASPAQRKLYESFIFTQTTKHGKSIFHDAFVEVRCVKGLRTELGKVSRKGMEVAMEAAAASIPGNEGRDTSSTNLRGTTQVQSSASRSCTWLSSTNPACPFFKVAGCCCCCCCCCFHRNVVELLAVLA